MSYLWRVELTCLGQPIAPAHMKKMSATTAALVNTDLDAGADPVTAEELSKVLDELGLGKDGSVKPTKTHIKPTTPAAPPPAPSTRAPAIGELVGDRLQLYQRAAVTARQGGRMDEALHWLRRSKDLVNEIEAVVAGFPTPEEKPWAPGGGLTGSLADGGSLEALTDPLDTEAACSPSSDAMASPTPSSTCDDIVDASEEAQPTTPELAADEAAVPVGDQEPTYIVPEEPPWPGTPPATLLLPTEELSTEEELPTEDDAAEDEMAVSDAADPCSHLVSLRVVEFEASRYAADPMMLAALERRKAALSALKQPAGAEATADSAAGYAVRLERAVAEEKARSREAKLCGNTKEALHALRRAKIMMEELNSTSPLKRTADESLEYEAQA